MKDTLIEVNGVSFSIGEKQILKNVRLEVRKGQFVGIIGPNGSGKTTLIKHLYNAIVPKKSCIKIAGRSIENYSQKMLARQLTVMKQENRSAFDFKVMDMVLMGRAPYRRAFDNYTKEDIRICEQSLEAVGMATAKDRFYSTLSGGEKQRVLLARSFAQETEILLMDEPTNHLDVYYQIYIMQSIKALRRTVLSVFHDLNLSLKYCDYLYVLRGGEIVASGKPDAILTSDLIKDVYNLEADVHELEGGKNIVYNRALPIKYSSAKLLK